MNFTQSIQVGGHLKLTVKDALTGEIIKVDEGSNLVLDTGLQSLSYLMAGDITVPSDVSEGSFLNSSEKAIPHLPIYGQFGTNATVPRGGDISPWFNGSLSNNAVSPLDASDILRANHFYPSANSVTIQFLLPPNKGNGIGAPEGIIYREAVLMCKVSDSPIRYNWFARRVFSDITKTYGTLIEAEWTFTFVAG